MSTTPRVAFLTAVYDTADVGGGTYVHYLRQAVENGELDIVFFSDDIRSPMAPYEQAVSMPRPLTRLPGGWITRAKYYNKAFSEAHNESPFDLVWHNNALTCLFGASHKPGLPVIGMVNDYNNLESKSLLATRKKFGSYRAMIRYGWHQLEKRAVERLDYVVVNSRFLEQRIAESYGVGPDRLRLLYKGVDFDDFSFERGEFCRDGVLRILFVKNDYVRGGLYDLLDALDGFDHPVELLIVGTASSEKQKIERRIRSSGLPASVRFNVVGPVGRDRIAEYFRYSDVLCVPSRSEALGVVFMEALAAGLPVISTRVGGIPEVLDNGSAGWLVGPQQPAEITKALHSLLARPAERERKVAYGRKIVERFSHRAMIKRMGMIIDEVNSTKTKTYSWKTPVA